MHLDKLNQFSGPPFTGSLKMLENGSLNMGTASMLKLNELGVESWLHFNHVDFKGIINLSGPQISLSLKWR